MGIPRITPYQMPTEADLPESQVRWRPHPARAVLLVHDMQQYFVDFFAPGEPPVTDLVANVRALRDTAHELGMPVVYTAQPGSMTRAQRGLLADFWGRGMTADDVQRRIVTEVAPGAHDTVLTKWRYSAFYRTGLRETMRRWGRDQVVVCGVYAHIGVLATALDAFTFDIQPFLVADALADFSRSDHELALDYAARRCARAVLTDHVVGLLYQPTRQAV